MHKSNKESDSSKSNNSSPAGFIRIRRMNGDRLSKGTHQGFPTSTTNEFADSLSKIARVAPKATKETGFLKIVTVASLAESEGSLNAGMRALESAQQSRGRTAQPPVTPTQNDLLIRPTKPKSKEVFQKMLAKDKLLDFFKCMGGECSFSTSDAIAFEKHIRTHEIHVANETVKDYLKCAYCYIDNTSYESLTIHLRDIHMFCRYCCKYCFYRAFASSYVEIHQQTYHPLLETHVLFDKNPPTCPPMLRRLDREKIIKPYVCVHGKCFKSFFIPEYFINHLEAHHRNITIGFNCHLCDHLAPGAKSLIEHYKTHGYYKYHCMYCVQGASLMEELHSHLSTLHCNRPPTILERKLQSKISMNKSAINHLLEHDMDRFLAYKRILFCKHCTQTFTKIRGLKLHLRLKHIKFMPCLCPYFDRSARKETLILAHINRHHKGLPMKVVQNQNTSSVTLSSDFWKREYGIIENKADRPPVNRKRKRVEYIAETGNECNLKNRGGKSAQSHKTECRENCYYCPFSTSNSIEMRQHWLANHRLTESKIKEEMTANSHLHNHDFLITNY